MLSTRKPVLARASPLRTLVLPAGMLLFALFSGAAAAQAQPVEMPSAELQVLHVKPSQADAAVRAFDEPNLVVLPRGVAIDAPLAVFLPGTGGRPENARLLLAVIAQQGYRAIGLAYNNEPAVVQLCPKHPQPECSADFRRERVFGGLENAPVSNPVDESIVRRLVMLLRYLHKLQPDAQWQQYLDGHEPAWSRIVVSGLSQGAGMAAYIAKQRAVARVVLFSSPWTFYGPQKRLAPWLSAPSATTADRWFAALHQRENTAALIAQAYRLLAIPDNQVRVLDLESSDGGRGANPFHASTVRFAGYQPDWQWLYGRAASAR